MQQVLEQLQPRFDAIGHWLFAWQVLAVGIAVLCAITISAWTTRQAVNRQIDSAMQTARLAEEQMALAHQFERRRVAREELSFLQALDAAMVVLEADIHAIQEMLPADTHAARNSQEAYFARQRLSRVGFAEVKEAVVAMGGALTADILLLEREITDFASQCNTGTGPTGDAFYWGAQANLWPQLQTIVKRASSLRNRAAEGRTKCRAIITDTERPSAWPNQPI